MALVNKYLLDNENPFPWDEKGDNCMIIQKTPEMNIFSRYKVGSRITLNNIFEGLQSIYLDSGLEDLMEDYILVEILEEKVWDLYINGSAQRLDKFEEDVNRGAVTVLKTGGLQYIN